MINHSIIIFRYVNGYAQYTKCREISSQTHSTVYKTFVLIKLGYYSPNQMCDGFKLQWIVYVKVSKEYRDWQNFRLGTSHLGLALSHLGSAMGTLAFYNLDIPVIQYHIHSY